MTAPSHGESRARMVAEQLARRGIRDPAVLSAMATVPRELFVPEASASDAYADRPLPIGAGQTISQPYVVAAMIEALHVDGGSRVLDVGSGSGYTTAILATIAADVVGIERHASLAAAARARLEALGIENATIVTGDGMLGHPPRAPYDAILVSAATDHVPKPLLDQLAPSGILVIPVGDSDYQTLRRIRRNTDGILSDEALDDVRFVPLVRGLPP